MTIFKILTRVSLGVSIVGMMFVASAASLGMVISSQEIIFTSYHDPHHAQIFIMDIDRRILHHLTQDHISATDSIWSPDGKWIAFTSNQDGKDQIYIMDANGGHIRKLTASAHDSVSPVWSPDSSTIAFSA